MSNRFKFFISFFCAVVASIHPIAPTSAVTQSNRTFIADVWADNWFALYINGKKVGEDSIPITTTKSFNKESITFTARYPFTIGVIGRDYVENNSGLEYIGTNRQQIGDAGLILQVREKSTGNYVTGTNGTWKSLVIFSSPLNPECVTSQNPLQDCRWQISAIPNNWATTAYKDSKWSNAQVYTESEVGVKEGYLEVRWNPATKLIWSRDLKVDNTVLFRKVITGADKTSSAFSFSLISVGSDMKLLKDFTCDGAGLSPAIEFNGVPSAARYLSILMTTLPGPPRSGEVVSGKHYEWVLYNIPTSMRSIPPGGGVGMLGKNFQNKNLYAAPCSQGPGEKTYTFTLFAYTEKISDSDDSAALEERLKKVAITSVSQNFTYARTS